MMRQRNMALEMQGNKLTETSDSPNSQPNERQAETPVYAFKEDWRLLMYSLFRHPQALKCYVALEMGCHEYDIEVTADQRIIIPSPLFPGEFIEIVLFT